MKKYTSFGFTDKSGNCQGFCRFGHWRKESVERFLVKNARAGQLVEVKHGQFGFKQWQCGGDIAFTIQI